jgi:hypothetical protein
MKKVFLTILFSLTTLLIAHAEENGILKRVTKLQETARKANGGMLGCGVGTYEIHISDSVIRKGDGLDPIHVFGKVIFLKDIHLLLQKRSDFVLKNEKNEMSGDVSDLGYVCLSIVQEAHDPSSIDIIAPLLNDKVESFQDGAKSALKAIAKENPETKEKIEKFSEQMLLNKLVNDLDSADGNVRVTATKEIFLRGKEALAALKEAGANQVAPTGGTANTRRLNIVYSLIEGLPPTPQKALAGYKTDSFGLHVVPGTTAEDVVEMGKKYGFKVDGSFKDVHSPSCYVRLAKDKALAEVLQRLLTEEPKIRTINLNYFDR